MRLEFPRPWVRFPAGLRCVFSSDPAVSSSIFVGAEREELFICKKVFCTCSARARACVCVLFLILSVRAACMGVCVCVCVCVCVRVSLKLSVHAACMGLCVCVSARTQSPILGSSQLNTFPENVVIFFAQIIITFIIC